MDVDRNRRPDRWEESDAVHGGIGFHFTVSIHACGCSKILLAALSHFFQSLLRSWTVCRA
jgi:hypothetical protein